MRRINVRKRNIFISKSKNIQKAIFFVTFILILIIFIYIITKINFYNNNLKFSNINKNIPFSLNKIILFSSATANAQNVNQSILELDISQYCDIGIYINNLRNNKIASLYINNISVSSSKSSNPIFYRKNISDIGKCTFNEENIIDNEFRFNLIDPSAEINYNNYEAYNDLSSPIAFGFYNKNIRENFLTDDNEIIYDGTLLSMASISKTEVNSNISFKINIITTSNEHYICNVGFEIPLEDNSNSVYLNGYIIKELSGLQLNNFVRIK